MELTRRDNHLEHLERPCTHLSLPTWQYSANSTMSWQTDERPTYILLCVCELTSIYLILGLPFCFRHAEESKDLASRNTPHREHTSIISEIIFGNDFLIVVLYYIHTTKSSWWKNFAENRCKYWELISMNGSWWEN